MISAGMSNNQTNNNDSIQPKINAEYASEWGILPNDKYSQLKESIRLSGQLNPIIVDQNNNIVDGHNRYQILQELGIEPVFEVREFKDELSARDFVITSNLVVKESSTYVKIMKAQKLRHIFEEKARLNQQLKLPKKGQKGFQPISAQNLAPIGRVSKKIAKVVGVSYRTVEQAEKIEKIGSQKQIQDLINDKRSIYEVSREIESEEEKKQLVEEARKINSQLVLPPDGAMLYCGNIQDPDILAKIPDEFADISITDPPYEEKYLPLYEALPAIIKKKLKPGASFFSLYGDKVKDRYEDCLKAEGLVRMPCEISIELQGSFNHDLDLDISRKKKDMLWYYKPDKDGKRFKTGELL
jgi:ParB-like nuclease family protein